MKTREPKPRAAGLASGQNCKVQKMSMSKSMNIKRSYFGVFLVLGLVIVTLYMAFAFPYSLFHLKQTETTEIKSVIIVARNGERSPSPESYFIGEDQPDDLIDFGFDQLTNTGKERMYLLGKYLKLRYYQLLLNGDPRKIYVRSADSDRCLESAQALLAGLLPPKDRWVWSSRGELNNNWQPKAVHSALAADDDLLSGESECLKLEDKAAWKNSTRYQQLLSEFRHDLQTLRANTGLEFEDDLEMLCNVEDALATRKAYEPTTGVPSWYTSTLANRLGHIADVTAESRFQTAAVQRLYVGRLLHEIARNVNSKIRLLSLTADNDGGANRNGRRADDRHKPTNGGAAAAHDGADADDDELQAAADDDPPLNVYQMQKNKLRSNPLTGPNMFIYLTNKHRLTALLNSLQIYSSQLHFGSLLLIELHHDPINQVHFLRLFTVSSHNANTFPEPLRVNPKACLDSAECYPQQFEQNIRHLMLDKAAWQEACSVLQDSNYQPAGGFDSHTLKPQPLWPSAIDEPRPAPASTLAPPPPPPPGPPSPAPAQPVLQPATDDGSTQDEGRGLDEDSLIVGPLNDQRDKPPTEPPFQLLQRPVNSTSADRNQTSDLLPAVDEATTQTHGDGGSNAGGSEETKETKPSSPVNNVIINDDIPNELGM